MIDDTSVNSGEPNEQFINDDGIQYRIETSSDGVVRLYVEGQTDPIQVGFVHDIVSASSTESVIAAGPTIWQLPSGRRILVGSDQAIRAFGQRALTTMTSIGTKVIATITAATPTSVILASGAVLIGVLIPSNVGQSNYQDFQLNEDATTRFRTLQGESIGDLQQLGPNGEWITTATGVSFDQLTDEQLALINGPMAGTNTDPVQSSQNLGFPDQSGELGDNTSGGGFRELDGAGEGTTLAGDAPIELTRDDVIYNNINGSDTGEASGRSFDSNNAGGPIERLDWRNAQIDGDGLSEVRSHVSRFGEFKPNKVMLDRLEAIERGDIIPTDHDLRFYTHELRELERYRNLEIPDNVDPGYDIWNNTHTATLEDYGLADFDANGNSTLYHPDARLSSDD